ncbi:thiamine-phosphate kinase [Propionicimonas sp.]|uniref:thiamine-phosphate kinase n=1 Tax=Propionicimonas sp. TaxID=1955623 RepID=UPI00179A9AB2|nr:thiamine-phosphate kinase [Propionicimonas sp.]MBU3977222.1 thiamine-phosphate kinase [Actinomycetota bacterium]MBA3021148.1 thiamine-phosphate kinase [Propionicimonas sp.]MBU3985732.1 thiamine-phosphate kinase [Actinomycetota bacterium]MBU4008517.1 thiamine-phosphate kinase [Actinomycetota bacterium]MBU4066333.1 thiamine-phosphate kinase [Actinomycetota bacterium]
MSGSAAEVGEFALIDRITAGLGAGGPVLLGVGDDAAVLRLVGDLAVSTDTMVENVHFRRNWSGPDDVGRRAVGACVADAEAMGAVPVGVVVSLAMPTETPTDWVDGFARGVRAECEKAGAKLVGGDLTAASLIVVTVTVLADLGGVAPVTRSGARPGEVVAFVGRLGWAAAGLAVLTRGFRSPGAVVVAHRVPEVPYGEGRIAAEAGATAMIDVSDGLLADLGHVAQASGVCIELDSAAFEIAEPQQAVAAALGGGDPLGFQLTGGDDHALVATFPPGKVPAGWTPIGKVASGQPSVLVDGAVPAVDSAGWKHF